MGLNLSRLFAGKLRCRTCTVFCIGFILAVFPPLASADMMTLSGAIIQSTQDGTGPAVNNPSLNDIWSVDNYLVRLTLASPVTSIGTSDVIGLTFTDMSRPGVTESAFGSISLIVSYVDASYDLSLFGCLTTGSGCLFGNQLVVQFRIPVSGLNSLNVSAEAPPDQLALDLLEDDGVTDIHGTAATYSYISDVPTTAPEPASVYLASFVVVAALARASWRSRAIKHG